MLKNSTDYKIISIFHKRLELVTLPGQAKDGWRYRVVESVVERERASRKRILKRAGGMRDGLL